MVVDTSASRSFSVQVKDERAPALLGVLSTIVALQRYHGFWPHTIRLNTQTYVLIGNYLGTYTVDRLFNVRVQANLDADAMPFVIEGEYKRQR